MLTIEKIEELDSRIEALENNVALIAKQLEKQTLHNGCVNQVLEVLVDDIDFLKEEVSIYGN